MSYTHQEDDVPMISELVVKTPLVERLVADLAPQLQGGTESATLAATILDAASDHSDDEPEGLVSGLSGDLVLNVRKYEKMKMAMKFSTAYYKKYIAWVRKFIKDKESKTGKSENYPTMGLFRLYIELRDQLKSRRIRTAAVPRRSPAAGYGSSSQEPVAPAPTGPMSRAKSKSRAAPATTWSEHEWLVMPSAEPEPVDVTQARRLKIQQKIEALMNELEALNELVGGLVIESDDVENTMSKAERKLCRRGVAICSQRPETDSCIESGIDVLFLEADKDGQSVFTAVGFQCQGIFEELSPEDVRSSAKQQRALECIRKLRPKLLVLRTPNHMTKTIGGPHLCRTFTGRQRAAFTRMVTACCGEQLCEGRMFCIEVENESMSDRVKAWHRVRDDSGTSCVERVSEESV